MKKANTIKANLKNSTKNNTILEYYTYKYSGEKNKDAYDFYIEAAKEYVKALKENRILCVIKKRTNSGSLHVNFTVCSKNDGYFWYSNLYSFLRCHNVRYNRNTHLFVLTFINMDSIFDLNYRIIHSLYRDGIITKKQCDKLAQKSIQTI